MFKDKPYKVSGKKFGPPPKRGPNPQGLSMGSKKEVKVKAGYHKMPDGSIMKNSAHKGKK